MGKKAEDEKEGDAMGQVKTEIRQTGLEIKENKERYFRYTCSAERISFVRKGFLALTLLMTAAFVLTGTYSCRSMGDIAVLLSWAFYLVPLVLSWNGLLHFLRQKETVSFKERKKGPERLQQSGGVAALIAGVSVFACIYFLVTGEYESIAVESGMVIRTMVEFIVALGLTFLGRLSLSDLEEIPDREKTGKEQ